MLEGNEIEKKYDGGEFILDVDDKGKVKISASYEKDLELAKVKSVNSVETDVFKIMELITKKTKTELDDKGLAVIKSLLGIKDEAPPAA